MDEPADSITRYRTLPNGVKVLCNINSKENEVLFALSLKSGYLSDSQTSQGLSHAFEHAALLGSRHYPGLMSMTQFVCNNDGTVNGVTGPNVMTFGGTISHKLSGEFVKRCVDGLTQPTLCEYTMQREVEVLHNEYHLMGFHPKQVTEDLMRLTAVSHSPNSLFSFGCHESLTESGIPLSTNLAKKAEKIIHGSNITVALQMNDPDLLDDILATLSIIPKSSTARNDANNMEMDISNVTESHHQDSSHPHHLYREADFMKLIKVKQAVDKLMLLWIIDKSKLNPRKDTLTYIAKNITSEHRGGLIHRLRERKLACSIDVDHSENVGTSFFDIVTLCVTISDLLNVSGRWTEVVLMVYEQLRLLSSLSSVDHKLDWKSLKSQHKSEDQAVNLEDLEWSTIRMFDVELIEEEWFAEADGIGNCHLSEVRAVLKHLVTEPVQIHQHSPNINQSLNIQRFTGLEYSVERLPQDLLKICRESAIDTRFKAVGSFSEITSKTIQDPPSSTRATYSTVVKSGRGRCALVLTGEDPELLIQIELPATYTPTDISSAALDMMATYLYLKVLELCAITSKNLKISPNMAYTGLDLSLKGDLKHTQKIGVEVIGMLKELSAVAPCAEEVGYCSEQISIKYTSIEQNARELAEFTSNQTIFGGYSISKKRAALLAFSPHILMNHAADLVQRGYVTTLVKERTTIRHVQYLHEQIVAQLGARGSVKAPEREVMGVLQSCSLAMLPSPQDLSVLQVVFRVPKTSAYKSYANILVLKEYISLKAMSTMRMEYCLTYAVKVTVTRYTGNIYLAIEVPFSSELCGIENLEATLDQQVLQRLDKSISACTESYHEIVKEKVSQSVTEFGLRDLYKFVEIDQWDEFALSNLRGQIAKVKKSDLEDLSVSLRSMEKFSIKILSGTQSTVTPKDRTTSGKRKAEDDGGNQLRRHHAG